MVPDRDIGEIRDLVRRRHYMVKLRTMLKNKIHAEVATRWIKYEEDFDSVPRQYEPILSSWSNGVDSTLSL